MLYESYQRKVQKVASFLKGVLKHIVLISVSASVLVLATVALLITKGIITSEGTCPETVAYGQEASFKASAFMSSVSYEYSADGVVWSGNMPVRSGKYLVRAVSDASFGGKRYSEPQRFELLPKEITVFVKEDGLVYGEDPTPYAELIGEDRFAEGSFTVEHHSDYLKTVCFAPETIKIVDSDGNDVTYTYKIFSEEKTVSISKRDITFTVADSMKVYDGTPLTSGEYTIASGTLVDGDLLEISFEASITNVGTVKNAPKITIKNNVGSDVTNLYNITLVSGELTVTRRPISLSTPDESYEYDGSVPTPERYTLEEKQLAVGHTPTILSTIVCKTAGKYENTMSLTITDADGNDVTDNYELTTDFGTVTITKRALEINTASVNATYSGESVFCTLPQSYSGLVDGESLVAKSGYTETTVVSSVKNLVEYIVLTSDGEDVTSSYEISYTYGTITINRLSITVETADGGGVYKGDGYFSEDLWCIDGTAPAKGDKIEVAERTELTAVGAVDNVLEIVILGPDGEDRTPCYDIAFVYGTITVTHRSVTLRPSDVTEVYSGSAHGGLTVECEADTLYGLAGGHSASAVVLGERITVGETTLSIEEGSVVILDADGEDVTANYELSYGSGLLTVEKREIHVITGSASKPYDGTPLTCDDFGMAQGSEYWLAEGHRLHLNITGALTNVNFSDCYNYFDESEAYITDEGGEDVTENYSIIPHYGTLTVTPRHIKVATATREWIYDGLWHNASEQSHGATSRIPEMWTTSALGLVSGQSFLVTAYSEIKDVIRSAANGEILSMSNTLLYEIVDTDGNIMTYNYAVDETAEGTLKVKPREVEVSTHSMSFTYDDTEKTYKLFDIENKVSSHTATVAGYTPITYVGSKDNVLTIRIYDESDADVTLNYNIIYSFGKIEVTKRSITVATDSKEWTYDGYEHAYNYVYTDAYSENALVSGHYYSPANDAKIKSVGTIYNTPGDGVRIYKIDEWGEVVEVTDNYGIDYALGTLTVTERSVTLRPTDVYIEHYDGKAHGGSAVEEADSTRFYLADGHTASAVILGQRINAGYSYLTVDGESVVILDGDGNDVTSNYDLTYERGTVTVGKRPITVLTGSANKVYDGTPLVCTDFGRAPSSELWLIDGHELHITTTGTLTNVNFDTVINPVDKTLTYITPSVSDDGEGADIIDNYDITYEYGTLAVTPRPIRVQTASREWIYDSTWHSALEQSHGADESEYTEALWIISKLGLVLDHEIEITEYTYIRDFVGCVEDDDEIVEYLGIDNYLDYRIIDSLGNDVSYNYDFSADESRLGKLVIKPFVVNITTQSYSWIYDGKWHSDPGCSHNTLPGGDWLELSNYPAIRDVKDSGMKNTMTFTFYNLYGEDMSSNYMLGEVVWGTLTVTKREITVTTNSDEKIYDGTPLINNGVTHRGNELIPESGLVSGHSILPYNVGTITNAGSVENGWGRGVAIYYYDDRGDFVDATDNYEIIYECGTLTVHKRPVALKPIDVTTVYDGTSQGGRGIEDYVNVKEGYEYGLVATHTASGKVLGESIYWTEIPIELLIEEGSVKIVDASGADMLGNYDITLLPGKLTVNKRPIYIVTGSATKIYDATPLTSDKYWVSEDAGMGLVNGDTLFVKTYGQRTDKGKSSNTVYYGEDGELCDTYILGTKLDEDGNPIIITDSYEIHYELGILEITPRPILVTTPDGKWIYDGAEHKKTDGYTVTTEIEGEALLESFGHYISIEKWTKALDKGKYTNKFTVYIWDDDDEDVTGNYEISYTYGYLEITPRPITVITSSATFPYRGAPYSMLDMDQSTLIYEVLCGEAIEGQIALVAGGEISVNPYYYDYPTITVPGSIDNVLEFVIIEYRNYDPRAGEWDIIDVTYNYEITPQWGKITVVNREVTIKPQDSLMYNGKAQSSTRYVLDSSSKNGLIEGHEFVFSTSASLTKVGKAENLIVGEIKVYDKSGADITEYYTVTAVPGELEITKRPIKIVTPDKEKIYDGTALTSPTYILSTEDGFFGIADGDMLVVVVSGSRITVGSSPNSFTYTITNSRGEDVTDCYDATASSAGTLTVKPYATIVVWSGSDWKYYDGTPLTKNDAGYSVENGGKLLPGHRIELNAYGSQTEVGNSKNFVEVILIDSEGNRLSVGDYYEIDTSFGKLEVRAEGDPPGEKPKTIIYSVKGEKDGSLYLKTVSYGDYIGSGYVPFAAAEEYESCINGTHSAAYLASLSFKNSGLVSEKISVMVRGGTFALPYYASFDDTANIQQSDTVVVGDVGEGKQYSVNVYRPGYDDYLTDGVPSRYVKYESDYRRFVYENYLDVPASTKSYLEQIIISNGFDPTDPYIVEDIVQYFINSGITYDLDYNTALDDSSDVVVAFLESYRSGVCRHFAAAAALMFRTMGVPARFTVGYYAYTQAGEWVDVTDDMGHAWIEIYIDGIGWVMAEVTPPSGDNPANGGSGGSGGNGAGTGNGGGIPGLGSGPAKLPTQGSSKPTLEIQPVFLEKLYDGTPLNARTTTVRIGGNEVYKYLEGNLAFMDCIASNCFVEFEIEGRQDGVGESLSYVKSFKILNRRGADITDNYEIVTKPGKLFVYDESTPMIRVYLYEQQFGYDGRERSFLGDFDSDTPDYMHLYKSEGIGDYKLDINIGLVSADVVGSSEINNYIGQYITAYVDGEKFDGRVVVDVYDGYEYSKEGIYIPLRIDKRRIEITASVNADDPGNIVTGYSMTLNKPANGDQATVTVTYSVDNKLVTAKINTVSIRNKLGMDVTSCYEIITKNGTDTLEQ